MVAPVVVVAGAMAGSAILNYVLNQKVSKAQIAHANYAEQYGMRYNAENKRYWQDYYRNTGFRPRYPMRSGAEYNLSGVYSARASRAGAYASQYRAAYGIGLSGAYGLNSIYKGYKK